jgi:3-oxoacyl-ACP reductase-like protein
MISSKGFLHHPLNFLLCLHRHHHFPFPASHGQNHETHQPLPEGYGDHCFLLLRCSSSFQAGYGAIADAEASRKAAAAAVAEHTTLKIEPPLETAESSVAVESLVAAANSVTLLLPESSHHQQIHTGYAHLVAEAENLLLQLGTLGCVEALLDSYNHFNHHFLLLNRTQVKS